MNMKFTVPCTCVREAAFGCASLGFAGSDANSMTFAPDLQGVVLSGSYEEILSSIPEGPFQAGIVLFGNAGGENTFMRALQEKARCPFAGGGAATDSSTGEKALITGGGEAAVFLIRDDRYDISVVSENIHNDILGEHEITMDGPRVLAAVDGVPAAKWLSEKKAELGIAEGDFEHLTLADLNGVNAHLSCPDGIIRSGRDLCPKMTLRYLAPDKVQERMQAFYGDEHAVIFGCAGLKGILNGPITSPGVGLFLFGEVCTFNGVSEFGNLMCSKLRAVKK